MKIRQGFISNSSSSSFIVGVAKIEDKEKFDIIKNDYIKVLKVGDIKNNWSVNKNDRRISVESFQTSVDIYMEHLTEEDYVAIINISNNEGDDDFYCNDDYDIDYDIDSDFFDKDQQELFEIFTEKNGLSNIDLTYGAGRNG